jgi:lipopolysaccharide transport system ATP-binding protein
MAYICASEISVKFKQSGGRRLFPSLTNKKTVDNSRDRTILSDLSFELRDGDRVGIIGRNGAGKTTLLKVLSKILKPTSGQLIVRGEAAALFGPLPFIDSNLTARENVINYCKLTGFLAGSLNEFADEIKEFSGLGDYFEDPIRIYSAGMRTRFDFTLSTSFSKEIIILDEGIGAGDQFFQQRVSERLEKIYSRASILIIASHSEELIRNLCNVCLVLENGIITLFGSPEKCFDQYKAMGNNEKIK